MREPSQKRQRLPETWDNNLTKWKGRQVIDLDKWKGNGEKEGSESA